MDLHDNVYLYKSQTYANLLTLKLVFASESVSYTMANIISTSTRLLAEDTALQRNPKMICSLTSCTAASAIQIGTSVCNNVFWEQTCSDHHAHCIALA